MTVVILDLVSDRRERRVSGIHASAIMISESQQDLSSADARAASIPMSRCMNLIAVKKGERGARRNDGL
jgi:hypothetical protein